MLILEERGIPRSKPNGVSVCGEVWLFLLSSNSEIEGRLCALLFDLEPMLCFQHVSVLPKNTIRYHHDASFICEDWNFVRQ